MSDITQKDLSEIIRRNNELIELNGQVMQENVNILKKQKYYYSDILYTIIHLILFKLLPSIALKYAHHCYGYNHTTTYATQYYYHLLLPLHDYYNILVRPL